MAPRAKWKWLLLLVLTLIVSTTIAQDAVHMPPSPANTRRFSHWQEFKWASPIEQAAVGAIVLAFAGMASVRYIASNRRQMIALFVVCTGVGLAGYAFYDRVYVGLTLSMRNIQQVRDDCEKLMQAQKSVSSSSGGAPRLTGTQVPPSLARIGGQVVFVESNYVVIYTVAGMHSGHGYLFDPTGTAVADWIPYGELRGMIYRGFYQLRTY